MLTIGSDAILNFAGIPTESGHASFNNYGTVDPDGFEYTTASNGNAGLNLYDLYIGNIGAVQVSAGTSTWFTPMVLTGTSVADAANNIGNGDVGEWQLSNDGTLVFNANTVDAGQAIVFEDATDTLVIGQVVNGGGPGISGVTPTVAAGAMNLLAAGGFAAEIWGYQAGDQILFDNLVVNSDSIVGGNTLELFYNGGSLGELTFYNKAGTRPLGSSGMAAAAAQMECFAAGTRLLTARGEVAVEAIAVGERVRVLLGDAGDGRAGDGRAGDGRAGDGLAEVVWVGRREVDCARHPQPRKVWPVRVAAGAFGAGPAAHRSVAVAGSCGVCRGGADSGEVPDQRQRRSRRCRWTASPITTSSWRSTTCCWPRGCRWRAIWISRTGGTTRIGPGRCGCIRITPRGCGRRSAAPGWSSRGRNWRRRGRWWRGSRGSRRPREGDPGLHQEAAGGRTAVRQADARRGGEGDAE